jgi:hypothetical protein
MHIYVPVTYTYMCMCVRVCVCVRVCEREVRENARCPMPGQQDRAVYAVAYEVRMQ